MPPRRWPPGESGPTTRGFEFPSEINTEDITANLEAGMLKIHAPKAMAARRKVIDALFWSSVINGVLAPPLLVVILLVTNNPAVMGQRLNGKALNVLVGLATALMFAAAISFFLTWS